MINTFARYLNGNKMNYKKPEVKIVPVHYRTIICQSSLGSASGTNSSFEVDDKYEEME